MRRKSISLFFKTVAISLCCCGIFLLTGYFYLEKSLEPAENGAIESVPYYSSVPQNAGVLLDICGDRTFFYLDFEGMELRIIFDGEEEFKEDNVYGYNVDYSIFSDYSLLSEIVDIAGGVEMTYNDEKLTFTGVQISEILSTTVERNGLRRDLTQRIVKKISQNGIKKEDLLYIIENSETNLTVPACYYWPEFIKELCGSVRVVN